MAWHSTLDGNFLVTGCGDGSLAKWKVIEEANRCDAHMSWNATNGRLVMSGACIQKVCGLTKLDVRLLKQHGAIGEPEHLLHEASEESICTASVESKLETSNRVGMESPIVANPPTEQETSNGVGMESSLVVDPLTEQETSNDVGVESSLVADPPTEQAEQQVEQRNDS
jgi:hypothetical protein